MREPNRLQKILVVDDEPDILRCLCYHLGDYFTVIAATSGFEAKKYFDGDISLAILDYRLPDMTGIEVLKEIKEAKPSVPVIILTGYGDEGVAVNALRCGAKDYIKKPFIVSDLIKIVEQCLSIRLPRMEENGSDRSNEGNSKGICDEMKPHTQYKLQNAIKYIKDNYSAKISLDAVAAKACMSKYHFSRSFKKATGTTYRDYLNRCRIEKAKDLLSNSSMQITEIAFAVGYTDITNFERIFKRIAGLAPSQYKPAQHK